MRVESRSVLALLLAALVALSAAIPPLALAEERGEEEAFENLERALRRLLEALERSQAPEAARLREAVSNALRALEEVRARGGSFQEAVRAVAREMAAVREEAGRAEIEEEGRVPRGLIVAVNVRLEMIKRLEETIAYLQERGVEVDPQASALLEQARARAEALKAKLEAGEVSVPEAAREIGEISRLIAQAKALIAKSRGEWERVQLENAALRAAAKVAAKLRAKTLELENLTLPEIRESERELEELLRYRHLMELKFRHVTRHCDISEILRKLGINEMAPGFFGRAVAKLAQEDPRKLREVLAELKACLIETASAVPAHAVPETGEAERAAVAELIKKTLETAGIQVSREVSRIATAIVKPTEPVRGRVRVELSVAEWKRGVELTPSSPVVEFETREGQGSRVFEDIARLRVQGRPTVIQIVVRSSSIAGGDALVSVKVKLVETRTGEEITISVPCAAASGQCFRVMIIIPGHDAPLAIAPGEYKVSLEVNWAISGSPNVSVSLTIR